MSKIQFEINDTLRADLGLSADANDTAVANAITAAINKNKELRGKVETLGQQKQNAEEALNTLKADVANKEVEAMLEVAIGEGKITAELKTVLSRDYNGNPTGLKTVLGGLQKYQSVADRLGNGNELPEKFRGKTYMELHTADLLPELQSKYPQVYEELKKEYQQSKS